MKKIQFRPFSKESGFIKDYAKPSIRFIPEWYKKFEPYSNSDKKLSFPFSYGMPNLTIKRCVPFLDAMTIGYMVSLTDDIFVEKTNDGSVIRWRNSDVLVNNHTIEQFDGFPIPEDYNYFVWKWNNDWGINLPEGYSIYFTHPSNRFDLPFQTFSGVVDCDSYDFTVKFPFIVKKDFEGIIEAGTPICQLIPFKREEWKTQVLEYNEEKNYLIRKKLFKSFISSYKKNYWHKKKYS